MEASSASPVVSSLFARPRVAVAVIAATATVSIGIGILLGQLWQARATTGRRSHNLRRRNAVRRQRRSSSERAGAGGGEEARETGGARGGEEAREAGADGTISGPVAPQRAGQNIVSLLFRVSEDNARRGAYVHRGCACNACGIVPIRGIRYRCANCADFDLCETCEAQGLHFRTHVFYKIKVPAPPFGPRQMQPVWYPGDPDSCPRSLPRSLLARLSRETGFERQELEAFWEQWTYMANTEWRDDPDELCLAMDRQTFERCLVPSGSGGGGVSSGFGSGSDGRHAPPNLIHDRMFAFYDTNNDDLIGFSEFLHGLSYHRRKDKLRKIFDGYDADADGLVSRRDFLRFFRAYYVLYKQMHHDILDGLDDQVMSSVETQQLIANRQPLSSLFGREGRVPPSDVRPVLDGKMVDPATGEITVVNSQAKADGATGAAAAATGAILENSTDTAERNDMLEKLFLCAAYQEDAIFDNVVVSPSSAAAGGEGGEGVGGTVTFPARNDRLQDITSIFEDAVYWRSLLTPPTSVQSLATLFEATNNRAIRVEGLALFNEEGNAEGHEVSWEETVDLATEPAAAAAAVWEDGDADDAETGGTRANGSAVSPQQVQTTTAPNGAARDGRLEVARPQRYSARRASDAAAAAAAETQPRTRLDSTARAQMSKNANAAARAKLLERWKRRQFYVDEEEGSRPPAGWAAREDVLLAQVDGPQEGGGADEEKQQLPSRSRSSSKVRFAADTEDFEIRSNPSTSSRSVPERWGGMDIPDAERDAGREILYQVMQQSFNELLDILFKAKEDLALAAAETRQLRQKHRPLFAGLDEGKASRKRDNGSQRKHSRKTRRGKRSQSLENLLAASGYTVEDGPPSHGQAVDPDDAEGGVGSDHGHDRDGGDGGGREEAGVEEDEKESSKDKENGQRMEGEAESDDGADDHSSRSSNSKMSSRSSGSYMNGASGDDAGEYRDPTMPQFRPGPSVADGEGKKEENAAADREGKKEEDAAADREEKKEENAATAAHGHKNKGGKDKEKGKAGRRRRPSRADLLRWKQLDAAEQEAKERGGWGRLNYAEFEAIFKREEEAGNRLDYLGSWIDFCIP